MQKERRIVLPVAYFDGGFIFFYSPNGSQERFGHEEEKHRPWEILSREFGVILALGASTGRLRRLVLLEASLLGALSMVLGTGLGAAATWYLIVHGIDLRQYIPESLEVGGIIFEPVLRAAWDLPWMG